jgi:phosphoadenosine phosphosulfate reductase
VNLDLLVQRSVAMLQIHVPADGKPYYGAFSGGKDSIVVHELAKMAEVPVEWHDHLTTIDPPELVQFVRQHYPHVVLDSAAFKRGALKGHLILNRGMTKGWPQWNKRWCCAEYKEYGGDGRTTITGVRIAESERRKTTWTECFMPRIDRKTGKQVGEFLMPIRLWSDNDVWDFIHWRKLPYCKLYDEGFKRLGCIGCPELSPEQRAVQFKRWPVFEHQWKRLFEKLWLKRAGRADKTGKEWWGSRNFDSWQDLYQWWVETAGRIPVAKWCEAHGRRVKCPV